MDFLVRVESLRRRQTSLSKSQRGIAFCGFLVLVVFAFYILPTLFEALATRYVGLWVASSLIGDLAGCVGLFFLGCKREALSVYLLAKVAELGLVMANLLPGLELIWVSDLLPTIVCADLLALKIFSANRPPEFSS
jgi:hypothetical protein